MEAKPRDARVDVQDVIHGTLKIALNDAVAIVAKAHTLTLGSNTISRLTLETRFSFLKWRLPRYLKFRQKPRTACGRRTSDGDTTCSQHSM